MMKTYQFTIVASGLTPQTPDFADRFFEAGCDDATIAFVKGLIVLEFERAARNFTHAVVSAIRDVQNAGAKVEHIEPDYLVSLSEIAERTGMSRSASTLFAKGERGQDFPHPIARVTTDSPLWDWVDVARWMYRRRKIGFETLHQARVVRELTRVVSQNEDHIEASLIGKKILSKASIGADRRK